MGLKSRLRHRVLIKHPDPSATADETGQLFIDATGQPIGDATVVSEDWSTATEVPAYVEEKKSHWPEGPGAGPQLVDTYIYFGPDAEVRELDKLLRIDTEQAYQAVWVNRYQGLGPGDHVKVEARRIPL